MSKRETAAIPVIEWSPTVVRVALPGQPIIHSGSSIEDVRGTIRGNEVVVAVSRRSSFIRTVRLPDAPKHEVAKVLTHQISTLFPVGTSDVAVDFALTQDRNGEGRLVVVAAMPIEALRVLQAQLAASGLRARAIVPAALGSAALAGKSGCADCAIVEECPEGLAIDIIHEFELRASRVVPMPSASGIAAEVGRSFAVAKVPGAQSVAAGDVPFPGADLRVPSLGFAELGSQDLPLTLEMPDVVAKRVRQKLQHSQRIAVWLWVATILLAAVVWDSRSTRIEEIRKGEVRWQKQLASLRSAKSQAEATLAKLTKVKEVLTLGFEPKQRQVDVAATVSNLVPTGVWLTGVTLERGKPAAIRGTAMTGDGVAGFLNRLSQENRLRDVSLVFANNGEIERVPVVQFSISAHVVGNLPLDTKVLKP